MSGTTGRLALPMLEPGQAQKETMHNEALARLDLATQASVLAVGVDAPPTDPAVGQSWIVGAAPRGDWAGRALALAGWTAGGWRFVAPFAGLSAWSVADAGVARFDGAAWRVARRAAAIANPAGGNVVGAQAGGDRGDSRGVAGARADRRRVTARRRAFMERFGAFTLGFVA